MGMLLCPMIAVTLILSTPGVMSILSKLYVNYYLASLNSWRHLRALAERTHSFLLSTIGVSAFPNDSPV
ncbi:hypothetical protein PILCRDRAFT_819501 [Piloderma croceum F 1598]|uniref:Uncharacterized protein n=1 Tax=Piloderma croceum (strain F 1598) TaxID=765440 RepID=A0A0C3FFQ3_PILCF|nr:hypothetical protein PILCRDRAFT_819501 [Piloderma croceum F 1598]